LNNAYTGVEGGLTQQQSLTDQLQPGVTQGVNAQGVLSEQLANEAAGEGPNPAQAALNQTTGQNIAQTAALMAGQRGAGANPGALATEAAQQGATTQQQAVGQSATLQAQQELAAQQEQQNLASTQVGEGATAVQNVNQQQQNEQNILQGANTSANNAEVGMQSNINNVNSQTAAANQNMAANTFGGILSAASSVASMFAKGGLVKMDKGGNMLDANARKQIAPENFALPGKRYPIHDAAHARNALARVSQHGTPAEKSRVKAAVLKKYPNMGVKKMADGGDVDSGDDTPAFAPTPSDTSSGPSTPSTSTLPADSTNFASDINKPSNPMGGGSSGGGGGMSSIAGLAAMMAKGGQVRQGYMKRMAEGGYMAPMSLAPANPNQPQSFVGRWVNTPSSVSGGPNIQGTASLAANTENMSKDVADATKKKPQDPNSIQTTQGPEVAGGPMDTMDNAAPMSPGAETADDVGPTMTAYSGGLAAKGGGVNAASSKQKAKVKGDSLKNDKIPAMLSEGEVVMDRDTLADPGPVGQMARAVAKHIAARNKRA